MYREVDDQLALDLAELGADLVGEIEHIGRQVELVLCRGVSGLRLQLDWHAADTTSRKCCEGVPSCHGSAGFRLSP